MTLLQVVTECLTTWYRLWCCFYYSYLLNDPCEKCILPELTSYITVSHPLKTMIIPNQFMQAVAQSNIQWHEGWIGPDTCTHKGKTHLYTLGAPQVAVYLTSRWRYILGIAYREKGWGHLATGGYRRLRYLQKTIREQRRQGWMVGNKDSHLGTLCM